MKLHLIIQLNTDVTVSCRNRSFPSRISIALPLLKRHTAELLLRAGLTRTLYMREHLMSLVNTYEPRS